jgi:hypothetical protein
LPPVDPEKRVNITYPADALVLNFFWLALSDVSIPCSGVCFLERNGWSTSRLQQQRVPKRRHLRYDGGSNDLGRLSNGYACALVWGVLEPILQRFYET